MEISSLAQKDVETHANCPTHSTVRRRERGKRVPGINPQLEIVTHIPNQPVQIIVGRASVDQLTTFENLPVMLTLANGEKVVQSVVVAAIVDAVLIMALRTLSNKTPISSPTVTIRAIIIQLASLTPDHRPIMHSNRKSPSSHKVLSIVTPSINQELLVVDHERNPYPTPLFTRDSRQVSLVGLHRWLLCKLR